MIRDITIGQYYPEDSFIHRLDPRVKLLGTVLFIISLFTFSSFSGYIVAALFLGTVIKISKVPLGYIIKGLKSLLMIMLFAVVFNVFFSTGERVLYEYGVIHITAEGLRNAAFLSIRLVFLIIGSSLMTFTTTPTQLTDGIEKVLGPLNKIKVPVHEIAMMMSIALRFIPILMEELDKIMKAQTARGADFENGKLIERVKAMVPILIPLFISAFRRANDLAMAMEARCYRGGTGRTKMKPLTYKKLDFYGYCCLAVYFMLTILAGRAFYI
ncbi:energy-coupling factor transporter transmembrane component T family protein [[Clostridium] polysaccharolyticum]|jgi:energy-coupling factor transport system permease protein|uniref:Energy-coupling factor transporter transmembrane protein EcfT n=1 Tax=[Clostridium] polysaccharolyticum TaxID=29364 RepID=A0A1I0DSX9_9FIRM|nr:energy-coupling factor transporter transmembrane component T [[Clostridium] polysaccharolyticum]SET35067.1 energy-coupling factor transport system permease protein [[Clostridium] polysaccharolyticum]